MYFVHKYTRMPIMKEIRAVHCTTGRRKRKKEANVHPALHKRITEPRGCIRESECMCDSNMQYDNVASHLFP